MKILKSFHMEKENVNIKRFIVRKAHSREKTRMLTAQHFANTSKIKRSVQSHKGLFYKSKSISHRSSRSNYRAYRMRKSIVLQPSQQELK